MTSPVAVMDLSFNSTDITDLDGIMLERIEQGGPGTLPTVAGSDDPLPGADGVFPRNRRKRTRQIELRGHVFGTGVGIAAQVSDYWDNREALETLFNPTVRANLVAVLRNGNTATIEAWPISVDFSQIAPMTAQVSVVLVSTDPDWTIEATGS
jgi:hypothetical protein